jgi:hypothetical protein
MEHHRDFEIGEHHFRAGRLEPRKSFHIQRRLLPLLLGSVRELVPFMTGEKKIAAEDIEDMLAMLLPVSKALAEMPEEDVNYVLDGCLETVTYKIGGDRGWVKIWSGGASMYDWLDSGMMVQMVQEVVSLNLTSFFQRLAAAVASSDG